MLGILEEMKEFFWVLLSIDKIASIISLVRVAPIYCVNLSISCA